MTRSNFVEKIFQSVEIYSRIIVRYVCTDDLSNPGFSNDILLLMQPVLIRYAHLFDDPPRQATERVGAIVTAAGNDKTAEVVKLHDGTA